jgi:hypothetical protein
MALDWYNGWSPEKRLATLPAQREAIRSGAIPRPTTCSICGSGTNVWLHDENYADPLAAYHVCRLCHRTLHERFDHPEPWLTLVRRFGDGSRWFEYLTMDQASLRQPFVEIYPTGLPPLV